MNRLVIIAAAALTVGLSALPHAAVADDVIIKQIQPEQPKPSPSGQPAPGLPIPSSQPTATPTGPWSPTGRVQSIAGDYQFSYALRQANLSAAQLEQIQPILVDISRGFDTYNADYMQKMTALSVRYRDAVKAAQAAGDNPLTGDSDLVDYRARLSQAISASKRDDWLYIVTNGRQGRQPDGLPSRVWPFSGQMVMRSGWDAHAHWAYFDAGPNGGAHGHYDNLQLSVFAFGREVAGGESLSHLGRGFLASDGRWPASLVRSEAATGWDSPPRKSLTRVDHPKRVHTHVNRCCRRRSGDFRLRLRFHSVANVWSRKLRREPG